MTNKKPLLHCYLFICLTFALLLFNSTDALAAGYDITIKNNDNLTCTVNAGDTGKIIPDMTTIDSIDNYLQNYYYYYYTDKENNDDRNVTPQYNSYFNSYDREILTVDEFGNYQAISPGTTSVDVSVYAKLDYYSVKVLSATIVITVNIDMTNVTLSTDSVCTYLFPTYYYAKNKPQYNGLSTSVAINSEFPINTYYSDDALTYSCSNSKLKIDIYIENNTIYINQNSNVQGTGIITITIYGKVFTINYEARKVGISDQSYLLPKKKKYKITITGYEGDVIWKSSNPSIASVDSKGNVTGKKIGNCIITAMIDEHYLGCAVSVTTSKLKKVTERATYIGTHWKYSQPKRAKKGYYDCSALVWKAYKEKAHVTFGTPGYPGNTTSESAWCKRKGLMIKGGMTYKKFIKMKVNPGDIMFKSSDNKNKYGTTYHVEMFTGYICNYVESDGTAYFSPLWAARGSSYMWEEGSLLARPLK